MIKAAAIRPGMAAATPAPRLAKVCHTSLPRRSEIDYWWPLARAACGLEHVRLHDLRHAAASAMVNAGIDLGTVGAVLGHKSTATTKRYAHHGTQRLADALATIKRRA
jgi:site-specific recombinase XerD